MVTSPTGKGVIVMGGSTAPREYTKTMFELAKSMEWTRLEQTLQIDHLAPLAIPVPDELDYEIVESEDKEHVHPFHSMKNHVVKKIVNFFKLFKIKK